jgi:hypothetical protein
MTKLFNDWTPETRSLLQALWDAGFSLTGACNGQERIKESEPTRLVAHLTSVDEAVLYVSGPIATGRKQLAIYLVFGNSPGELVCDYSCNADLEKVLDAHSDSWAGKPQPMKNNP